MAATYEPIATTTLSSAASSITFSSIPSTYTDLRIVLVATASAGYPKLQFNSDTATNYSETYLRGDGTSATSSRQSNVAQLYLDGLGSGISSTIPMLYTVDIFSYAGSTYKTALWVKSGDTNGGGETMSNVGLWRSTAAITTVTITESSGTLNAGTTATIYGIKAA